jgi:hypothetical protein
MRETPTYAHLISCCLTDGGESSFLQQKARAQKARKMGLPGLSFLFAALFSLFIIAYAPTRAKDLIFAVLPGGKNYFTNFFPV